MTVARTIANSPDAIRLGGVSHQVAAQVEGLTNIECRVTILGHLLRGGSPSAFDRLLATRYGVEAVHMVVRGQTGIMVGLQNQQMVAVPLEDVAGRIRTVTPNHPLVKAAQSLGICLGVSSSVPLEEHYKDPVAS